MQTPGVEPEASVEAAAEPRFRIAAAASTDEADTPEADRTLAGSPSAVAGPDQAQATDAECVSDLGSDEATPSLFVIVADHECLVVRRSEEAPRPACGYPEDARMLRRLVARGGRGGLRSASAPGNAVGAIISDDEDLEQRISIDVKAPVVPFRPRPLYSSVQGG